MRSPFLPQPAQYVPAFQHPSNPSPRFSPDFSSSQSAKLTTPLLLPNSPAALAFVHLGNGERAAHWRVRRRYPLQRGPRLPSLVHRTRSQWSQPNASTPAETCVKFPRPASMSRVLSFLPAASLLQQALNQATAKRREVSAAGCQCINSLPHPARCSLTSSSA